MKLKSAILFTIILLSNIAIGQISIDSSLVLLNKTRYRKPDYTFKKLDELEGSNLSFKQRTLINEYKADIYWFKGSFDSSIISYKKNIIIFYEQEDTLLAGHTYADIGYVYMDMKKYKQALDYYQKAFLIAQKYKSENLVYLVTVYKAQINEKLGYFEKALKAYNEALVDDSEKNNTRNVAIIYSNIANIYLQEKKYEKTIEFTEKALKIWKNLDDENGYAIYHTHIGIANQFLGNLDIAEKHLLISVNLNEKLGKEAFLIDAYLSLVSTYLDKNDLEKAQSYLGKSKKIRLKHPSLRILKDYYSTVKRFFLFVERYDSAYHYLNEELKIRDSILNSTKMEQITFLLEELELEKKEFEIGLLTAEHEKDIIEIDKRNTLLYFLLSGGLIMLFLTLIAYKNYKKKNEANIIISKQNEELNLTNEELSAQRDEIERQKEIVDNAHNEVQASISYAKRIQNAILPSTKEVNELLPENFILYKPKDVVAGDFYWISLSPTLSKGKGVSSLPIAIGMRETEDGLLFAAADCTGHGVPGAMVSVVCHNAMNRAVREFGLIEPGLILDKTREIVVSEFEKSEDDVKDGMDIALCSLTLHSLGGAGGGILQYAGAYNPLWIIRSADNLFNNLEAEKLKTDQLNNYQLIELKADKQPIGKYDNPILFKTHTLELQKGDAIYIFSDGYSDQFGGVKNKKFGIKRFKNLLLSIQNKTMKEQGKILSFTFEKWKEESNQEQIDDVCVIGIKVE